MTKFKAHRAKKAYVFRGAAALVTAAVFTAAVLLFTACPQTTGGQNSSGGGSGTGGRIAITRVRAKAAPLALGETIPGSISYTYTDYLPSGVEGETAKLLRGSTYGWHKKNGTEWQNVSGQPCTEGTYRIKTQVRIDDPASAQYMLSSGIKVSVSLDGGSSYDERTVSDIHNYDSYSCALVISKECYISGGTLLTLSSSSVDIPKSYVGKPVSVDVSGIVSGGTRPYRFSVTSGALPAGLLLGESGIISDSPTAPQAAQTEKIAQITVRDSASPPGQKVIDLFCTEGIIDKRIVTFKVGWRGTDPEPIEVDPAQTISAPTVVSVDPSCWDVSAWCTSPSSAQYGTDTWDFSSDTVTEHMTLYAHWNDKRTEITELTATMSSPAAGNPIPNPIPYTYSTGSPAFLLRGGMYAWRVWNGSTWETAEGTFESGKKYRIKTQMRIDLPDSETYRLAKTGLTVTVNGQAWTVNPSVINSVDYNDSESVYSYVWVTSPEFEL